MSVRTRGALITWTTGDREAAPVILLHDRYRDHDANDVLGALLAAAKGSGATVVLVTHDNRVAANADREVVLRDGIVQTAAVAP